MLRLTAANAMYLPRNTTNWPKLWRPLSISRRNWQLKTEIESNSTRGKKLKPKRAQIVVLNPREAGLFRRKRIPGHFTGSGRHRHLAKERLSALEGVEFDDRNSKLSHPETSAGNILQEIESQRRKLLIFKNSVPREQVVRSIHELKPGADSRIMSAKRYEQLKTLLEGAYTVPQLKAYMKKYFDVTAAKSVPKKTLITRIMGDLWQCQLDESISEGQDLIVERIIDVQTRDIYLILLTNNGKILHNFARLGATVAVALSENKIIVRATSSLVKYVEVSLRKILDNVQREDISISELIKNHHDPTGAAIDIQEIVNLVQKESATFFERSPEDESNTYSITSFGSKRITTAKVLLLWALGYSPQSTEQIHYLGKHERSKYMSFPFTDINALDWIQRNKDWSRLQEPVRKNSVDEENHQTSLVLSEDKIDELYSSLLGARTNATSDIKAENSSKIWSITLGQLLRTADNETAFQTKVAGAAAKLLRLPLNEGSFTQDHLYTVDQHEYFVQLKFIPNLGDLNHTKTIPPLELWFELDDDDKAINSSVRCLLHAEDKSLLLEMPQSPYDLKVNVDNTLEVTQPYDLDPENWLKDQPGLKEFLLKARLNFQGNEKLFIPKSLALNLQFQDSPDSNTITYGYVNVNYRRVLKLRFLDKYLVQFTDVNGGPRGGKFTQIDFVNTEAGEMSRLEFGQFLRDVLKF
ncbi:LADA_0G06062g1_1 [Lachancea dasiensis]|uniref:LADA_0G06062g1_1 n=1 Tax=Lachancea dasiensis TaxID=1072105 RepID=A0A1G4JT29_9SACH|nr:LADA_0G06062g1_1 [Lachancea dasiensis]